METARAPNVQGEGLSDADARALYDAEFAYVFKTLGRLGVRGHEQEDLLQETFLRAFRNFESYDRARPLRPWLFGIAMRVASDFRSLRRHAVETKSETAEVLAQGGGDDPEEALEGRQKRALVWRALDQLRLDQRAILVMHDIDGAGMPEIAETLDVPLNTGYSRLRLARAAFAAAVGAAVAFEGGAMSDIEALPPELEGLMAAERVRPDPRPQLQEQLWSGLAVGLVPPVVPGAPRVAAPLQTALKAAAVKTGVVKLVAVGVVAFGVGAGSGVVVDRAIGRRAPLVIVPAVVPAALPLQPLPTVDPPPPALAPKHTARPLEAAPSHDAALAAERALLDRARAALARDLPSEAYQATLEHEIDYAHGQLVEEREVLQIQALLALGRRAEALGAAEAFRARHPRSLLLPAVEDALNKGK